MSTDPIKPIPAAPAAAGGFLPWLPWIGAALVLGAVGATAGVLGFFGMPAPLRASSAIVLGSGVEALDCPGGAAVARLVGGERVLALARSDDSHYLQVRNPYDISELVWLPTGMVSADKNQPAVASLAVGGCPKANLALDPLLVAPVVTAPAAPTGGHPAPPSAPKETVKPVIVKASASPTTVYDNQASVLSVTATDNVGVTSVTVVWSGAESGSAAMHLVSGVWQYSYSSNNADPNSFGNITFSFVARDAAGNASAPASATVDRQYFG